MPGKELDLSKNTVAISCLGFVIACACAPNYVQCLALLGGCALHELGRKKRAQSSWFGFYSSYGEKKATDETIVKITEETVIINYKAIGANLMKGGEVVSELACFKKP